MIARRYAPLLFALLLSGFMSLMVSGISTLRATGPVPGFFELWISAWLAAWLPSQLQQRGQALQLFQLLHCTTTVTTPTAPRPPPLLPSKDSDHSVLAPS